MNRRTRVSRRDNLEPTTSLDLREGANAVSLDAPAGCTTTLIEASLTGSARKRQPGEVVRVGEGTKVDRHYDGAVVGTFRGALGLPQSAAFAARTDPKTISGVRPEGSAYSGERVVYVNGMNTKLSSQQKSMHAIAETTGAEVVGIHNATHTFLRDGGECIKDKLNIGQNEAHKTLTRVVVEHLRNTPEQPLNIVAHSQGGIITSRALRDARQQHMRETGASKSEAEAAMANIRVQTVGAAAIRYPSGPRYLHHVNVKDPVPQAFGAAILGDRGKKGEVRRFTEAKNVHSINQTYVDRLVSWEEVKPPVSLPTVEHPRAEWTDLLRALGHTR